MITFGPVPSRRLGRSLGINNIPPKICTYSCGYCHVGRTIKIQVDRKEHYKPNKILNDVRIQSPDESIINRTYQIFSEYIDHVEYLIGYEGNSFSFTGDVEEDILSITAVHPMREDAVRDFLKRSGAGWETVEKLKATGKLIEIEYLDKQFYLRRLKQ